MIINRVQHGILTTASTGGFAASAGLPQVPEGGLNMIDLRTVANATSYASTGFVFRMQDVPGYSELAALFEEYKIVSATVTFVPRENNASLAEGGYTNASKYTLPTAWIATDTDGQFANTNLTTVLQYGNIRRVDASKPFSITIRPKVATAVQYQVNTGVTAPQSMNRSWIAFAGNQGGTAGAAVDHWGGLVAFTYETTGAQGTTGPCIQYDVFVKYRIALRRTI